MADKTVIAHISDLHRGSRYHILAGGASSTRSTRSSQVVVVTGDLTDMGYRAGSAGPQDA
jgi:predicted MPP superfamily phosphohydrolase